MTTVDDVELWILQIKFFSGEELLCKVGYSDDDFKHLDWAGRVISFEIAHDEQLIGAELYNQTFDNGDDFFKGVTWLKIKIANWRRKLNKMIYLTINSNS